MTRNAIGAGKRGAVLAGLLGACCLAAALLVPAAADARALLEDLPGKPGPQAVVRGGKTVEGLPGGPAWGTSVPSGKTHFHDGESGAPEPSFVEYPLAPGKNILPERGMIEVSVTRTSPQKSPEDLSLSWNTVLDLVDAGEGSLLSIFLVWDANGRAWAEGSSLLEIRDPRGKWSGLLPLGFRAKPGDAVTVAVAWGGGPAKILVNNKEISLVRGGKEGAPFLGDVDFGGLVKQAARLRLGISRREAGSRLWRSPMFEGAITRLAVYDSPGDMAPLPLIASVTDDSFKVPGISGKLVAGDTVTAEMKASPGGKATFDMGRVSGIALEEVPPREAAPGIPAVDNGTYRGSYTIRPGDDFEDGRIVGHFVSADNVAADNAASASKWTIDTKPSVTFSVDKKDLPADSVAKARIKIIAKDANGNPVKGRHYKLTLATTDEYTGTVGAGDFGKEVGASVETRWRGETDSWGEIEFDYKAGFAAKTVILSAKDLDSGGVSVDYLTAYKEAFIDIALTQPVSRAAGRRGMLYLVKVEASRTELTADGRSRSVIRAKVLDPSGAAVSGDPVSFTLSSANGTLKVVKGTTDAMGTATADYIAGKKIGIVVVTATATLRNASGNVSITLLSDAPAKIRLEARPATLPADGFSRSDVAVRVTDINDNPNRDTKVEFKMARGGGKLEYAERTTDRDGDASNRYTAGTAPGIATIAATVRSKVPSDAELAKAKNVLFVPYAEGEDAVRVEKWLKRKGDAFVKGEPLAEYTVGRSRDVRLLAAPFDGTLGEVFVEYWDEAEVGQTLAIVVPAKTP